VNYILNDNEEDSFLNNKVTHLRHARLLRAATHASVTVEKCTWIGTLPILGALFSTATNNFDDPGI